MMLKITNNTYPNKDRNTIGTLCDWVVDEKGNLSLKKCNDNGIFVDENGCIVEAIFAETIMFKGQVYAQNGNLLAGKKEPAKIGVIASFKKEGWVLEVQPI